MLSTTERQNKALADEWLDTAMTYKIEWERELARRDRHGITDLPEPLPHPDHVQIDMNTGEARFTGPATKEEKAEFDLWAGRRQEFEEELEQLQVDLEANTDPKMKAVIKGEIEHTEKVLGIFRQLLPGV